MKSSVITVLALLALSNQVFAKNSSYVALSTGGIRENEQLSINEETGQILHDDILIEMPKCKPDVKCVKLIGFIFELPRRRNGSSTWKSSEIEYVAEPLDKNANVEMIELFDQGSSTAFAKVIYSSKRGILAFTVFEDEYKESSTFMLISEKGVLAEGK